MIRALFAVYFTALTFAGPGLCCCTVSAAVAQFTPTSAAERPTPHKCSCGHGSKQRRNDEHKKPCDQAPCSAKLFKAQPYLVDCSVDDGATAIALNVNGAIPVHVVQVLTSDLDDRAVAFHALARANPWHSSREALRALHMLRC